MAAGPHPRRELTLMPRLGLRRLGSAWPRALVLSSTHPTDPTDHPTHLTDPTYLVRIANRRSPYCTGWPFST